MSLNILTEIKWFELGYSNTFESLVPQPAALIWVLGALDQQKQTPNNLTIQPNPYV